MEILNDHRIWWTAAIVGGAAFFSGFSSWLMHTLNEGRYSWQQRLRARLGVAEGKKITELLWLWLSTQMLLWPAVTWWLLHFWQLHEIARDLRDVLMTKGFSIGDSQIVPAKWLAGLVWFLLLFTFTRWLRQKLVGRVLTQAGVEASTRESVATLFGYITFTFAAIVGLSAAGLDFGKLAIVAGALSVGIGFGLQEIFKNFISGLILLFEQRIRTGDQIVVGTTAGVVKKIHIRFTIIETGDRESVIVPNSELLSNHVKNVNLYDRRGRAVLPISVARDSDTALVKQLLLEVAANHPQVIRGEEAFGPSGPLVLFTRFGESSLDFELQVNIFDSGKSGAIASDLRFAITKIFRENAIEIAAPLQDVRIKEMPEQSPTETPLPPAEAHG